MSVQEDASSAKIVRVAVPVVGDDEIEPPLGGVFSASVTNAAATPLASSTSNLNLYSYPDSSASGAIARLGVSIVADAMNPSASKFTSDHAPDPTRRFADHDVASVSAGAEDVTLPLRRATSPALTLPPGSGGMDTIGGGPAALAAAETTVTVDVVVARLAPLLANSVNSYDFPAPEAPLRRTSERRADDVRGSCRVDPSTFTHAPNETASWHRHTNFQSKSVSWSGSRDDAASRTTGADSATTTSPPVITASNGAARTIKSNSIESLTEGLSATQPSNRSVYVTSGGRLFFGSHSIGVRDLVASGSSTTSVPSLRAADHLNS